MYHTQPAHRRRPISQTLRASVDRVLSSLFWSTALWTRSALAGKIAMHYLHHPLPDGHMCSHVCRGVAVLMNMYRNDSLDGFQNNTHVGTELGAGRRRYRLRAVAAFTE